MMRIKHICFVLLLVSAITVWGQQLAPGNAAPPAAATPAPSAPPVTQTIEGTVKFGTQLMPGVTVKVTDSAKNQAVTWTDAEGRFSLPYTGSSAGDWRVTASMPGFVLTHKTTFPAGHAPGPLALELILASRVPTAADKARAAAAAAEARQDSVSVFDAAGPGSAAKAQPTQASSAEAGADAGSGTIAIAGAMGKAAEAFTQQAGVNRIHGSLAYTMPGSSALDAGPYNLTGNAPPPPGYLTNQISGFLGGPLSIPHIYDDPEMRTTFTLDVFGRAGRNLTETPLYVPTEPERSGDFSGGNPIYDPLTGQPFPGNVIPQNRISPVAEALLNYVPLPNQPGALNYLFTGAKSTTVENIGFSLTHGFGEETKTHSKSGAKWGKSLSLNASYLGVHGSFFGSFPDLGAKYDWTAVNLNPKFTMTKDKWGNVLGALVNGSFGKRKNVFSGVEDVSGNAGITGISENPADWGLPSVIFANNYHNIQDIAPGSRRSLSTGFSDDVWRRWGRHSFKFGGEFQRRTMKLVYDPVPNGSFTFDGFATSQYDASGNQIPGTGDSFADFLLGYPQVASKQYGSGPYDFVNHSWSLYLTDNWKALKTLSFDLGLRYEYVSPYSEESGRLVNLDANSGFTAVVPVQPGETGPYSGSLPNGLVRPDYLKLAPAVGVAWKVTHKAVLRAGYRIHYDPDQYSRIAVRLAYEPPFLASTGAYATKPGSSTFGNITLQNPFPAQTNMITNAYGVDPNYRIGYAQTWLLNWQYELFRGTVLYAGYNGAKGTHLDMMRVPDRNPDGTWLIPNVQPFLWESSEGRSILHQAFVRGSHRMTKGLTTDATYTFGKSMDDASSIGGSQVMVAQNDHDLAAERGLSSFDVRHSFTGNYTYELPWGMNKRWLDRKGALSQVFGDLSWSGSFKIQSGTPFTANVLPNYTTVYQGASGSLRANYNGQPVQLANPSLGEWFNTAAFSVPAPGTFGNCGRNTIIGPGQVNFNMTLAKNLHLSERKQLDFRVTANNVFNTPHFTNIDTTVGDTLFGQVTGVGSMRNIQLYTGFKF